MLPDLVRQAADRLRGGEGVLCVLTVPWSPSRLSANRTAGRHWGATYREKQDAHLAAAWAYREAGDPVAPGPVVVDVLAFHAATMDRDNLLHGLKPITDALFKRRITPDDNPAWLDWGRVAQITGPEWRAARAWTLLTVRLRACSGDRGVSPDDTPACSDDRGVSPDDTASSDDTGGVPSDARRVSTDGQGVCHPTTHLPYPESLHARPLERSPPAEPRPSGGRPRSGSPKGPAPWRRRSATQQPVNARLATPTLAAARPPRVIPPGAGGMARRRPGPPVNASAATAARLWRGRSPPKPTARA